jgi:hypothetical protein
VGCEPALGLRDCGGGGVGEEVSGHQAQCNGGDQFTEDSAACGPSPDWENSTAQSGDPFWGVLVMRVGGRRCGETLTN